MSISLFLDGAAGTTGLLIEDLLRRSHPEFEILQLSDDERKDPAAKRALLAEAECAVLCLPDAAAVESAALADELGVRVLDASSAHRVSDGWAYGLPELDQGAQRHRISGAWRVANPGCYATGALLLLNPLSRAGLLRPDAHIPIFGISGYSGGGRAMLQRFDRDGATLRTGSYAHDHEHKHVREIVMHSPIERKPQFVPSVGAFERGMSVTIALGREALAGEIDAATILEHYEQSYSVEQFVQVCTAQPDDPNGLLMVDDVVGTNIAAVHCFDDGADLTLVCHLDNLGKGASLAAIQNLNIMFGYPEGLGIGDQH